MQTLTFGFADIERSKAIVHRLTDAYAGVRADHRLRGGDPRCC